MSLEVLLLFVPACFALNMTPGPNNLLSVTYASRFGFATACIAGLGRLVAFVIMITIAASGLAVVLQTSRMVFTTIQVVGALYLFYLALQLWLAPVSISVDETREAPATERISRWGLARQEFLTAAGNPKAILIFTAFLPQFVNVADQTAPQFFLLGSLFLVFEWSAIAVYAYLGASLGRWFITPVRQRLFNRLSASLLGAAGLGLLLSQKIGGAK